MTLLIATLPEGAPLWPVQRQGGRPRCLIHVEAAVLDRLQAMRGMVSLNRKRGARTSRPVPHRGAPTRASIPLRVTASTPTRLPVIFANDERKPTRFKRNGRRVARRPD